MPGETPEFKRCCFCFPLRRGLMGWGYLRLALDLLAIVEIISEPWPYLEPLIVRVSIFLFDAVFSLLLIVAGHKKNPNLLRISKIYGIVWLIPFLILGGFLVYWEIRLIIRKWEYDHGPYVIYGLLVGICFIFSIFVSQVYVTLLIRSEEIKLRNQNLEMQFVNNAADAESRCVITDNGHDTTAQ